MTDMIGERASKLGKVKQVILAKSLTLFVGFVCIGFAYLSTLLKGGVIEVVLSIGAIIAGPVYAVFMMGVFFPLIEEISALGRSPHLSIIYPSFSWSFVRCRSVYLVLHRKKHLPRTN